MQISVNVNHVKYTSVHILVPFGLAGPHILMLGTESLEVGVETNRLVDYGTLNFYEI